MRYPFSYLALIFISSLDISLTWIILSFLEGREVNPLAERVIETHDLPGLIVYKFCLMVFVIVVCEIVGRRKDRLAHALAWFSVAVSAFPVAKALWIIGVYYP